MIDQYARILVWLKENSGLKGKIPVNVKISDNIYLLYHYIDGETVGERSLTEEQVKALAEIIAALHPFGDEIPVPTNAINEDFGVPFLEQLEEVKIIKSAP